MKIAVIPDKAFDLLHYLITKNGDAEYDVDDGDLENGPGEVEYLGHTYQGWTVNANDTRTGIEFTDDDGTYTVFCKESDEEYIIELYSMIPPYDMGSFDPSPVV